MLSLEIRFLTGRYAASRHDDTSSSEWPPHPARLYSALTAALHDTPDPDAGQRSALEWLAQAGAPEILASAANHRHQPEVYVPTNDPKALPSIDLHIERLAEARAAAQGAEGKERARASQRVAKAEEKVRDGSEASAAADGKGTPANAVEVLLSRSRQPRTFPVALPEKAIALMRWPVGPSPETVTSLDDLCRRVTRLGHSSSLVSVRVVEGDADVADLSRWTPDATGDHFFRVPYPTQLELLEEAHRRHQQTEPRILPADEIRYRQASELRSARREIQASVFSDSPIEWIMYEVVAPPAGGRKLLLDIALAEEVARAVRGTMLSSFSHDAPEVISGHAPDGTPTERPHLAFIPLAHVGHSHADGGIRGVALIPPRGLSVEGRDQLLEAVFQAEATEAARTDRAPGGRHIRLTLGRRGELHLQRIREPSTLQALTPGRWIGPARRWGTVTPIALDRNPGNLRSDVPDVADRAVAAAEATIGDACANIDLPPPAQVWVHRRTIVVGAPAAPAVMPYPSRGKGPRRVCVHAEVLFSEPVRGPVILGAGRFFGIGLCAPLRARSGVTGS